MNKKDPFMEVMDFLQCRTKKSKDLSKKAEEAVDLFVANIVWVFYLMFFFFIALLLISPLYLAYGDQYMTNVGAFMHAGAGTLQVCHQLPYRSFMIGGVPFAVCARDVGIYLGGLIGFATVLLKKKPKIISSFKLPILAVIPIAIDGITQTILVLRESNNTIRFVTGFIFAFGFGAFMSHKILLWKLPKFREHVGNRIAFLSDFVVAGILIQLLFAGIGSHFETDYLGRQASIDLAKSLTEISEPVEIRSFYISSMSTLSVMADPYYESHRDLVLDDIRASDWANERKMLFEGGENPPYSPDNKTTQEFLTEMSDKEHKFGLWVVAILTEPAKKESVYISEGSGEYFYFDGFTGKLIQKTIH